MLANIGHDAWEQLHAVDGRRLARLVWEMPGLNGIVVCRRIRSLLDVLGGMAIAMSAAISKSALLLRAGGRTCALHLSHVVEIMRPLPVEGLANMPDFLDGLSIIRGEPTPIVSLARLFANELEPPTRFVLLRAGERRVALAVNAVLGVCELESATLHALPPLAGDAVTHTLQALGALDAELLLVLNSATILPDEFWQKLVPLQL